MTGKKRTAEEPGESSTNVTKASRTEKNGNGAKRSVKKSPAKGVSTKAATLTSDEFKSKALPLHLSLTHTPPSIEKDGDANEGEKAGNDDAVITSNHSDVGFIGNLALVPSVFSTGSYGWKGSKRITVELQGGDTNAEGSSKEKVQIMLTVNATVLGSKPAKTSKGKDLDEKNDDVAESAEEDAVEPDQ